MIEWFQELRAQCTLDSFGDSNWDVLLRSIREHSIVGRNLRYMLREDLHRLGVTSVGHQLTLIEEIKKLYDSPPDAGNFGLTIFDFGSIHA